MNAPTINISKEKAKEYYEDYLEAVKTRKEAYLEDLKQVYYHLSKGHRVLDIYEVFKQSGLNEQGEPKLAVCRADAKVCRFYKRPLGSGRFSHDNSWKVLADDVSFPSKTFCEAWPTQPAPTEWNKDRTEIIRETITAKVPIVPAHLLPEGKLDNYYILWEVNEWNAVPVALDPFLLRRVNDNAFVVLAEWDLTEVEQAVIRGL